METLAIIGLSLSFLVLAGFTAWMLVYTKIGSDWVKGILLLAILWYGMVVYFTPDKMMGWPHSVSGYHDLPDVGVILHWKVVTPRGNPAEEGIYLWMVPKEYEEKSTWLDFLPHRIFSLRPQDTPRAYKVPYSERGYEQISEAAGIAGRRKDSMIVFRKPGKEKENPFSVIKFEEVFRKAEEREQEREGE